MDSIGFLLLPGWARVLILAVIAAVLMLIGGVSGAWIRNTAHAKDVAAWAGARAEWEKERANWERSRAETATALAEASEKARATEQHQARTVAVISEKHLQELKNASNKKARVVADLRSNTLRLRKRWARCEADRLSDTAASTASVDAATRERDASAARIVRVGAEADAHIRALQGVMKAERE